MSTRKGWFGYGNNRDGLGSDFDKYAGQNSSVHSNSAEPRPTPEAYSDWQDAIDYFNARLFDGQLPDCIITLTRRNGAGGYFKTNAFERVSGAVSHEIAMNPAYLQMLGDRFALSVLVHELCHLWREEFGPRNKNGHPGTRGYHDRVWARKMLEVGLVPTDTGKPGGRMTGYHVAHFIEAGGQFDLDCTELLATGFAIKWHDRVAEPVSDGSNGTNDNPKDGTAKGDRKARKGVRQRFTCPDCSLNAWAKPTAKLACGDCGLMMFASARLDEQRRGA
jgi:ribosomal protein S27AE